MRSAARVLVMVVLSGGAASSATLGLTEKEFQKRFNDAAAAAQSHLRIKEFRCPKESKGHVCRVNVTRKIMFVGTLDGTQLNEVTLWLDSAGGTDEGVDAVMALVLLMRTVQPLLSTSTQAALVGRFIPHGEDEWDIVQPGGGLRYHSYRRAGIATIFIVVTPDS